ncbi:hypothetical protein LTR78_000285 [Recurvomyces mirabilis]|uniref:Uncharacterized protein n=1 Tax=Recurvomyces mirabilis TaxID=574656 RepID=A0AAE1C6F0_9PEZI|nr:hypothetical protein LTR78_000285 [Recurvomyces mirabilis]KAK5161940.1 hypothetical protein LTS14_000286 [Recurvomyces mirabilis]
MLYPCSDHQIGTFGVGSEDALYANSRARRIKIDPGKAKVSGPDLNIIFTCCQLYEEGKQYLYCNITKAFEAPCALKRYAALLSTRAPGGLEHVRHLKLDFSQKEYILFFAVHVPPFLPHVGNHESDPCYGAAKMLRELPHVQSLTLNFRSPVSMASDSAWAYTGGYKGHSSSSDFAGREFDDVFTTPCQRLIVDWTLACAKKYIQHIPHTHLEGFLKTSTKEKWDTIFAAERAGQAYDESAEKAIIENWSLTDLPPSCHCTTPCAFDKYDQILRDSRCREHWGTCACKVPLDETMRRWMEEYKFEYAD